MSLQNLLHANRKTLAYVIGNGINRYQTPDDENSWWGLLRHIAQSHLRPEFRGVPKGLSLTEFYDLVELGRLDASGSKLQQEFGELLSDWRPMSHHEHVTEWIAASNRPILTTNFDFNLNNSVDAQLYHIGKSGFTDYYPWESYFGFREIEDPSKSFGIWHVNGTCLYSRSIRLGLTHYMAAAKRAHNWIHTGSEGRLFSGKDVKAWKGSKSWLHIVFNCDLLIVGLGLDQNEVFLRWLLIERAKYFKQFPDRAKKAWYVESRNEADSGKSFFLKGVGVETFQVDTHDDIWGPRVWT